MTGLSKGGEEEEADFSETARFAPTSRGHHAAEDNFCSYDNRFGESHGISRAGTVSQMRRDVPIPRLLREANPKRPPPRYLGWRETTLNSSNDPRLKFNGAGLYRACNFRTPVDFAAGVRFYCRNNLSFSFEGILNIIHSRVTRMLTLLLTVLLLLLLLS